MMAQSQPIDHYIYIDYSDFLMGYMIIQTEKIKELLPKVAKFHHYKDIKHKKAYIQSIKRVIANNRITEFLLRHKIKSLKDNLIIFVEVIEFIERHGNCKIFASVDNNQFNSFKRLLDVVPKKSNVLLVKESDLEKGSPEFKLSLIIDTLLNIERLSK